MATLDHKKQAVLSAVRAYLREKEGKIKERVSNTGTVYFHTSKDGAFCGKLIRVADHGTNDKTVLISLRYDLIGDGVSLPAIKQRIRRTLVNCAAKQSRRRLGWLYSTI